MENTGSGEGIKKQSIAKWITVGSIVVITLVVGITVIVSSFNNQANNEIQLTAEDMEQLKYDADLEQRAQKQADSIHDQNYIVRETDAAESAPLLKGLDIPKAVDNRRVDERREVNRRIQQEEEAINFLVRDTPPPAQKPAVHQAPAQAQQTPQSGGHTNQTPMFVYSRAYGGAKYVEPKAAVQADSTSAQPASQLDALTLAALGMLSPSSATPSDAADAYDEPAKDKTRLVYSGLTPVTIHEGEMLEAVLENRLLVDTEPSPVVCKLSRDVFDKSGRYVVFPASSRVIGSSQSINYKGASRLFISFNRIILPNGLSVDLPNSQQRMKAMDAAGALGIVSRVDRRWMMQFGSAVFLGVIDGIAGYARRGSEAATADGYVISRASENFERVVDRIMAQYSSIVPTIRVEQGKTLRIYISEDMVISPYARISERSYHVAR